MPLDTPRKRAAAVGVAVPTNPGMRPESIPDAFYLATVGFSYLPLAAPPGGLGGVSDVTILGGRRTRTEDVTPLGG